MLLPPSRSWRSQMTEARRSQGKRRNRYHHMDWKIAKTERNQVKVDPHLRRSVPKRIEKRYLVLRGDLKSNCSSSNRSHLFCHLRSRRVAWSSRFSRTLNGVVTLLWWAAKGKASLFVIDSQAIRDGGSRITITHMSEYLRTWMRLKCLTIRKFSG